MPLDIADPSAPATATAAPADAETERAITQLLYRAARLADDRKFMDWMELFTDDGDYSAITHENLTHKGLRLFRDSGKQALYERVAYLMGVWQVPRGKTMRFVTNTEVSAGDTSDTVSATSNFLLTRTADLEHTVLHASGRYVDTFQRVDGAWRIKSRLVVVDSNLLPGEFTELL
jgi:3-phenylpropionate/cinnamic acid dioxygenase small subunit